MDKLPWSEVKELADTYSYLNTGQKVRHMHNSPDCTGRSNSMIVERRHDGAISIHCFRCGCTGYYGSKTTLKSTQNGGSVGTYVEGERTKYSQPEDCTTELNDWPSAARIFVNKAGLTKDEVETNGISWSGSLGRVVIPCGVEGDSVASFQTRKILKTDEKPKYLTYRNKNMPYVIDTTTNSDTLVLVEDALSAIRVGRILPALALLGVKLRSDHMRYIQYKNYKDFIVFLDDDNYLVKKAQLSIKKQLDKVGTCRIIHSDGRDPKEFSHADLERILL